MNRYLPYDKEIRHRPGYVYVFRIVGGPCKIGKAIDIEKRGAILNVLIPYDCEMVLARWVFDMTALECAIHKHFESKWIKGEWFNLTSDDISFIETCEVMEAEDYAFLTTPIRPIGETVAPPMAEQDMVDNWTQSFRFGD